MAEDTQCKNIGRPDEISAKNILEHNTEEDPKHVDEDHTNIERRKPLFQPIDPAEISLPIALPSELWLVVLSCPCTFPSDIFDRVMLNLVQNPNLTSSHLFRADILYDSEKDPSQALLKSLKTGYQPRAPQKWHGFELQRTMVRLLVPRNPKLDRPIAQSCHFLRHQDDNDGGEKNLVVYIPHIDQEDETPFYHPSVSQLAFLHTSIPGSLTLLYLPFPSSAPKDLSPKLHRTALHLLSTLHKHGQGQLLGYQKRVHHDQIIPQSRYQNTYTRLKMRYGKKLSEQWVEVTDPGKHVFEDIGIAAFLIELWREMYKTSEDENKDEDEDQEKPTFPGFIDIGCGNGLLVYILLSEGYSGCGFDARQRKTWSIFPESVQKNLTQQILIPSILQTRTTMITEQNHKWHSGLLPPGTFIISNHADELTAWTPLLAHLNTSHFIAIPCCSHDLSGARFRAPATTRGIKEERRSPPPNPTEKDPKRSQAAETGSLRRRAEKMPSAYATLCSYVSSLAREVGFEPEEDVLRIPSTRNTCVIGRNRREEAQGGTEEQKTMRVRELVERELKRSIESVALEWIERAEKLMKKPGSGH